MKKIKEYLLPIYIILNLLYILIGSYLITTNKIKLLLFSKGYRILLILNILVLLTIFIIKRKNKKDLNFKIIDIFLLSILLFGAISVIFAVNRKVAIYGIGGRYEGELSILYYFSLYMLSTYIEKKHKKIIVYSIITCGIIELIYAILQITCVEHVYRMWHKNKVWATGFITNPNFFGSFMIINLSYVLGLFIDEKKLPLKIIHGLLTFVFTIGLLISNTTSCAVGLIIVCIYLIIYTLKEKKYIKLGIIILIIITATILTTKSGYTRLVKDIIKTKNQTVEIAKGNVDEKYGSNRIYIWKNTLKVLPNHILTGAGIDNFYYAFGKRPLMMKGWFFDKAHNEYLQILICEGIFALISYLLLFGCITTKGIINNYKNKEIYLILPVIGYLVQAFFNISVIEVAPFFYISLGLLVDRGIKNEKGKRNNTSTQ